MKCHKKKHEKLKRKAWIEPEMMYSQVFRSLSGKTMWVLLRFHQKMSWEERRIPGSGMKLNIYEKTGLAFTYSEAGYFGISKAQFHRIIKLLVEKGFIDIQHQGGAYGRDYSRYRLSDRWKNYGTPGFKRIVKKRVLQPGLDVQARKKAKLNKDKKGMKIELVDK